MQLIYFTALICIFPQNYKPQSNPNPSRTPIQSLNICQLIQNISLALSFLCELAEGGDVDHTGGGLEKGHTVSTNSSLSVNLCIYRRLFSHRSKLTWFEWLHSENDIWFTYRWDYGTHMLPLGVKAQRRHTLWSSCLYTPPAPTWQANIHIKPLLAVVSTAV